MQRPEKPESPVPEQPQNGWWRTVLEAIDSNMRTVRLVTIILVATRAIEVTRTTR
jgi:hypothetical protein